MIDINLVELEYIYIYIYITMAACPHQGVGNKGGYKGVGFWDPRMAEGGSRGHSG